MRHKATCFTSEIASHLTSRTALVAGAASALVASSASAQVVGFDDIQNWTGTGQNQAALVIDWNDGRPGESLLWGFRFDGNPTGEAMFRAIDAADPRLFLQVDTFPFGSAIGGIGYDVDGDGFSAADPDDHYHAGFLNDHFWAYFTAEATPYAPGGWTDSQIGFSDRTLASGSWDGWSWDSFPITNPPGLPAPAAAVPEPASFALVAAAGAVLLFRRRRSSPLSPVLGGEG